jgi:plastocyanin
MGNRRVLKWAVPAALTALVLLATGSASAKVVRAAGAQTFTVNVDQTSPKANVSFLAYFPRSITVHPGDSVVFDWAGNGEPHTVTLGSLTDSAVSAFNRLTPAQKQSNGPPPPAFAAIDATVPSLFPQGPGDATQSVANPCFQRVGPVGSNICPNSQHEQPAFDGQFAYYNSGWLNSGQKWTMHLSGAISPGTYRFMCALHREEMQGKINVVPASKTIMSPSAQFALGQKQFTRAVKPLAPAIATLRQGQPPIPHVTLPDSPNAVLAGSGVPSSPGAVDEFGKSTIKIPVGGTVTWWIIGPHSITFNSDKTNDDIRAVAPDGTVHANPNAFPPAGGPGEPPPGKGGPTKGLHFKVVASSSWNGQGHHSSGVFTNSFGPPVIEGYKLKFTKAGTYHYICVVHDHMKGTVVVG